MSIPDPFAEVQSKPAPADAISAAMSQSEIPAEVQPELTVVAGVERQFSHPEIAEQLRSEEPFNGAILAIAPPPETLGEAPTRTGMDDSLPTPYFHPEISALIRPEDTAATAVSPTVSQPQTFMRVQPEQTAADPAPAAFSHPEISKEIQPEDTVSSAISTFPPEISVDAAPEATSKDPLQVTYSHPEISAGLQSHDLSASAIPSAVSQFETSFIEVPHETIFTVVNPPEISQEIVSNNTSAVTATISSPESSTKVLPETTVVNEAISSHSDMLNEMPIQPKNTSAKAISPAVSQPESSAACQPKSTTSGATLTTTEYNPKTAPENQSKAIVELGSATIELGSASMLATSSQPHVSAELDLARQTAITGVLLPTPLRHLKVSKEVRPEASTSTGTIPETAFDSEEIPVRTEISRDDRKAIIAALARKTMSQDAIFEPAFQEERKYVSQTSARKTITDHSKDLEAITSAEREGLVDFATRRTVVQPDTTLSPFQLAELPVWYTNPISTTTSAIDKLPYAVGKPPQNPSSIEMSFDSTIVAQSISEISEEVRPNLKPGAVVSKSTPKSTVFNEMSREERKDALHAITGKKVSQDATMEMIPAERKYKTEIPARKTISDHSKDGAPITSEERTGLIGVAGRKTVLDPDTPFEVPGFPIDPPLMPFSKKERRELVRSISMQIKEPEIPLWDMDLMDIKEAEEAELQKNSKSSPLPVEPTFDFDEPIKPKVPVRRSKRHRIVRVHATDYARAHAVESQEFCTNKIKSTKYTLMTFLPLNLFFQCSRAANLYFILIAALQLIPSFSPTSWGTTVAPLVFVLLLNAIKEGIDEFKRSVSDRTVNKQKVEVLNENSFFVTKWSSVIVGDIVRVKSDQEFPADLVFLSSADVKGLAYVETANLDGETNLKIRNAFYKGSSTGEEDETPLSIFSGLTIECELPNNRLYNFEGAINLQGSVGGEATLELGWGTYTTECDALKYPDYGKLPLDTRQVLLRGATLRNTEWILGVVVYTGADTKFVRNMIPGQVKITELERNMNILVAIVFMCQVALCVGLAAANDDWTRDSENDSYFIPDFLEILQHMGPKAHTLGAQFGRFLILLNQLIPISLYVTLEVVKVVQSYYIDWDVHMYHRGSKTHAKARTTNLNEELGQVQYVMADKTGTLTQNIMAFVQCSIGGVVYGTVQHEGGLQAGATENTIHTISTDPKLIQKLKEVAAGSQDIDSEFLMAFFYHLAICHVVHPLLAKTGEEGVAEDTVLKYTGASPDEEALVQGAADCGYKLKKRAHDELLIFDPGLGVQKFIIMAVLEFTSERKRMSIICRDSKGRIKLYCKGADSVIFKRLARGQEDLMETSLNQLEDFARCGYRTLCMAERQISVSEYEKWAARFRDASIALDDRDEKLAAVSETIERDMMLLGVTAVEDKLQGKVPETITLLAQAGIKVWVLTGDKLETSVSVALSCNLLADSMHLFLLSDNVSKSVPQLLRSMLDEARRQHHSKLRMEGSDYHSEMATVIEGSSLTVALEETNKLLLLELLKLCRSVVCCRVSPIQKAQVTLLLKDHGKSVILAIGDGANDCGMIKVAQIGVGIGGREGMAAVLASDYSLTRFRYLRRLLLVHGRWSYKRNRELVMYSFYKNIVYSLGNAYLAFYSGYSSEALYSAAEIATYNLLWTSLPTIAFAIFNKDLSDCTAENNPQLYMESQCERRPEFFWWLSGWALCAFWDSLIAFFFPIAAASVSEKHGESIGIWELGSIVYTMAVFIVNLKIITRMHNLNWFHFSALQFSTSFWLLVFFCLSFAFQWSGFFPDLAGVGKVVTQRPVFWLLLLLCPVAAILPYCSFKAFRNQQAPADFEVMREIEHGWIDGQFFPDAQDYVEQITAPIPERRTSLELPEDDYGPSPLQKEIADARSAVLIERGGLSKPPETEGRKDSPEGGTSTSIPPSSTQGKVDDKQLRPRRLTWREVVNDDELEDLTSSQSLGRDGRRRSNGFQVVTRHTDAPEAPIPLVHGPSPPQRKSILFIKEQGAPLITIPTSTVTEPRESPKVPGLQQQHPKQQKQQHHHQQQQQQPEGSRLKTVKANLAKHAEERRTLVSGPGGTPKKTLKKRQKIWDAVKEGSAERDPYYSSSRDLRHPLQRMQPDRSTTTRSSSPRAATPSTPRSSKPGGGTHAQPSRFDPSSASTAGKQYSRPPHSTLGHQSPRIDTSPSITGPRSTGAAPPPSQGAFKAEGDSKGRKTGPGHSRLNT